MRGQESNVTCNISRNPWIWLMVNDKKPMSTNQSLANNGKLQHTSDMTLRHICVVTYTVDQIYELCSTKS